MALIVETKTINNQLLPEYWEEEAFGLIIEKKFPGFDEAPDGLPVLLPFDGYSPLNQHAVDRVFVWGDSSWFGPDRWTASQYQVLFREEGLLFTYELGMEVMKYKLFFYALLVFELILLIRSAVHGVRSSRKILKPLSDITERAQNLTEKGKAPVAGDEMRRLRELAGTISSIDATSLDQRIPVDGTQKELKDLALAINSMLNRIDEAYRSQVRFVSDASHELRTPISVVQGYANLLDRWGKNDQETMQEAIDAIKSESDNMKDLIEQLLFLARGDNETMKLYPEWFNCAELAEEIVNETKLIDFTHAIRKVPGQPVFIQADRQLMKQALRILIDNSIKYTDDGGEILISVIQKDDEAYITVQDEGIGIEPDKLPYIFERFYRAEESRARKTGGSGLGLSIMKWIIDRHHGKIEVVSRKGIGTKTTIILPTGENNLIEISESV